MNYINDLEPLDGKARQNLIDTLPDVFQECLELIESEFVDDDVQPKTAIALRVLGACRSRLAPVADTA